MLPWRLLARRGSYYRSFEYPLLSSSDMPMTVDIVEALIAHLEYYAPALLRLPACRHAKLIPVRLPSQGLPFLLWRVP